jgi:hypothetical protein
MLLRSVFTIFGVCIQNSFVSDLSETSNIANIEGENLIGLNPIIKI